MRGDVCFGDDADRFATFGDDDTLVMIKEIPDLVHGGLPGYRRDDSLMTSETGSCQRQTRLDDIALADRPTGTPF
jgi:hypothetical protein